SDGLGAIDLIEVHHVGEIIRGIGRPTVVLVDGDGEDVVRGTDRTILKVLAEEDIGIVPADRLLVAGLGRGERGQSEHDSYREHHPECQGWHCLLRFGYGYERCSWL